MTSRISLQFKGMGFKKKTKEFREKKREKKRVFKKENRK